MAKQEWGEKRGCQSCGKSFYDMMRFPISCPECGAAFTAVEVMPRRGPMRGKGRFFPANREPAEDVAFKSAAVAAEVEPDADEDGEENGEDSETVADGDEADAVGEDQAA
ncbi:MAG TPA: TIGR02300 family protein [Rhodospirillaceae bacterium]|nr:TIGR02300 family protein [Rhodospirillaceae bacterium]